MKRTLSFIAIALLCFSTFLVFRSEVRADDAINPAPPVEVHSWLPPSQPGSILLLDDGGQPGQEGKKALDIFGFTYTKVTASGFASVVLGNFKIIFVSWMPTQAEVNALNARKTDIANWINNGGGIVVNAEWKGDLGVTNPYSFLPVSFDTETGWYHTDGVHIIEPTHPLVAGLTDSLLTSWGNSVHGKITAIPSGSTIVTKSTAYNSPHLVAVTYGNGKIVVCASDPEYHTCYGPGDGPRILLYNELKWAASGESLSEQPQLKAPWTGTATITQGNNGMTSHYDHGTWDNTFAIDVALSVGSSILAPADGIVKYVDNDPSGAGGKELALEHKGQSGKRFVTVYLHLNDILVTVGNSVSQGQIIAKSGATGDVTGPHLHFHIWRPKGTIPEWNYDSHTMPIERLILKRTNVDSDFREYDSRKGELDDANIAGGLFESSNTPLSIPQILLEVTPAYSTVNTNQLVAFTGKVTDEFGNGISNLQVGIDDPVNAWCTTRTTNAQGGFTYSITATKAGSFLFAFYAGSVTTTCILNVGMQVTFSSFPSLKVKNAGTTAVDATLSVNDVEQRTVTVNPGETKDVTQVNGFNPEITPSLETCPVDIGIGQGCIDTTGTLTVEGGELIRVSVYASLTDPDVWGGCIGVGGDLPYIIEGQGQICVGTDGISLQGSAGPGIAHGTLEVKIVSFDHPSGGGGGWSPLTLMVTDPLGNRVGFSEDTGLIDEIDWATYTGPHTEPQLFNIPELLPGRYVVELIGTGDDDYTFSYTARLGLDTIYSIQYTGHITEGEVLRSTLTVTDTPGGPVVTSTPPDGTPPSTTLTVGYPNYIDPSGNTHVTSATPFTLSAEDNIGGTGVAITGYRIYDTSYDSGWITSAPPIEFYLTGLADGIYLIDYNSTDNVGNIETTHTVSVTLDNSGPSIVVENPPAGWALQDGVTFIASSSDASGTHSLNFSIREANGDQGIPVGFEDIPATYNTTTGKWELFFNTLQLPDGFYIVLVSAKDNLGHTASITVPYSIRNWAVLELLPATPNNKAGRTMPVKFALRVAASVDPNQPFVYNEELTIKIYATDNPSNILQTSTFGDTARDYRINTLSEQYITNFQTLKTPKTYVVEVWRKDMLIGTFGFQTVK